MINDYTGKLKNWFKVKLNIGSQEKYILFSEREIWWCSIGINVGEEQNGKNDLFNRPVLIFRKLTRNSFIGFPLTSKDKIGSWYAPITLQGKTSNVLIHQVRIWDKRRLTNKIGQLDWNDFMEVKRRFIKFIS
ncbi:MAG: type II toxin-antitoxin system PemK/MazF family toxin [Patescibacteria group bacterium]